MELKKSFPFFEKAILRLEVTEILDSVILWVLIYLRRSLSLQKNLGFPECL